MNEIIELGLFSILMDTSGLVSIGGCVISHGINGRTIIIKHSYVGDGHVLVILH